MNEKEAKALILAFLNELKIGNFDLVRRGQGGYLDDLITDIQVDEASAMDVVAIALTKSKIT